MGHVEHEGGCLCGAVRYAVSGPPKWSGHCHCTSCRKATGNAFATFAGFDERAFRWTYGTPGVFASSPGVERSFCPDCGTSLTYRSDRWPGEVHVLIATLDDPEAFPPEGHAYVSEKLTWIHLNDGLPTFDTVGSDGD